ncbi:neither inactivation nor afterpotential protein C-like isoform X2 [Microplitis mediator]|uniref:neither inactivation nor afterpotential protein C-like isoform X2 n=1 Tax=Microplitis mediator TaxID=375433 RepID=UPI00255242E3|nr:neither inactivation nor afterpotential protein C-like isoform X2 [Microplitis mediator]
MDNNFKVMQDVKSLLTNVRSDIRMSRPRECIFYENRFKTHEDEVSKIMLTEDLASLRVLTEESILTELYQRLHQGDFHTFVGDILLVLNPNELQDIYGNQFHDKYNFKSRSDNEPHIYSVADKAYQDLLHNEEKQHIVFAGESKSGKTSNAHHLINHFIYLGKSLGDVGIRIMKAIDVIHAFCHTSSPLNENSTRCIYQTQLTFGPTGKASGAIFSLFQLEKWCVSTADTNRSNFFIFYYFYDSMNASGKLTDYKLPPGRKLHYLRAHSITHLDKLTLEVRNNSQENCHRFDQINETLILMGMESHIKFIWKVLSAILLIGEVGFKQSSDGEAVIENIKAANNVAELIGLDEKKFAWSLTNYCVIKRGAAVRRKYTCEEAGLACDVLACTLYQRLVDWVINFINSKLALTRTLFGDKYIINILDLFGFECFDHNRFEQLVVNTTNEQLQCYYNQRVFAWEMQEHEEELIPSTYFNYYDNQETIEQLMGNKYGIFQIIDEASRQLQDTEYISKKIEYLGKKSHINMISSHQFSVAHYTGKVVYDIANIVGKNRDFVSPEMINTMRLSSFDLILQLFTGKLTKTGNLISDSKSYHKLSQNDVNGRSSILNRETSKISKYNVAFKEQYSQTRKMRTCISTFRSVCLEILKKLSINSKNGGVHFVRCIRADLDGKPRGFNHEIVRQQIRALGILETARSRQKGYAYRIAFSEFLRRYQFLAFDFGEYVDTTKDNCRLLLVRLKMEGWMIGKSKVFLKYYNEEYLSRLYEIQVRKIIKIQSMLRAFLACKKLNKAAQKTRMKQKMMQLDKHENGNLTEDEAALLIQKTYRGHTTRKEIYSQKSTWDENTFSLMQYYCIKWKSYSIYQILLYYRGFCFHQLGQFSQQVHLFDRSYMFRLNTMNQPINLNEVDLNVKRNSYIYENPRSVYKLPFDFYQEFLDFNVASTSESSEKMKKTGSISSASDEDNEAWNAPFQKGNFYWDSSKFAKKDIGVQTTNSPHRLSQNDSYSIINTPFTRDPRSSFDLVHQKKLHNSFTRQKFVDHHSTDKNRQWNGGITSHGNHSNWSSKNGFHYDDSKKTRINPICELQTFGQKNENNESDNEPPFNFQAMLRKTTHQRQSMKRNHVYESNMSAMMRSEEYVPIKNLLISDNGVTKEMKNSMGQLISGEPYAHAESLGYSSKKIFSIPDKYTTLNPIETQSETLTRNMNGYERITDNLLNKRAAFNSETKVTHTGLNSLSSVELAPGVTVKGYCTEF